MLSVEPSVFLDILTQPVFVHGESMSNPTTAYLGTFVKILYVWLIHTIAQRTNELLQPDPNIR